MIGGCIWTGWIDFEVTSLVKECGGRVGGVGFALVMEYFVC